MNDLPIKLAVAILVAGAALSAPRTALADDAPAGETSKHARNATLAYAGLATGAAGVVTTFLGYGLSRSRPTCAHPAVGDCYWEGVTSRVDNAGGVTVMAFGAGAIAAGATMALVGAWRVPLKTRGWQDAQSPHASFEIGPTSTSFRVAF